MKVKLNISDTRDKNTGKFRKRINPNDLVGKRFGRLVVDSVNRYERNKWYFNCICDCGNKRVVRYDALVNHITESCGCKNKEINSERRIHGMYKTRFYKIYGGMKQRCFNPNNDYYHRYGGRGITICDRWLGKDGFIHFMEDMYDEYLQQAAIYGEKNISIDRIDPDGNYCPENCRWVPMSVQSNNKSKGVHKINYNGETLTLKNFQEKYVPNATYGSLLYRVNKFDTPIEELMYDTNKSEKHIVTYNGETLPLAEIVRKYGDSRIPYKMVLARLQTGTDIERALHEIPNIHNGQRVIRPISFREPGSICPISFRQETTIYDDDKRRYKYNGEELTVVQLIAKYAPGLNFKTFTDRMDSGWNIEDALFTPPREQNKHVYEYNGEFLPLVDIIHKYGDCRLWYSLVLHRMYRGWDIDRAIHELPTTYKRQRVIRPISFRNADNVTINFSNNNHIEP